MFMLKIAVVTATRAEYGILRPLIQKIDDDDDMQLDLLVTGTHLSKKFGNTQQEIIKDGFKIKRKIKILENKNTPFSISLTMANAIKKFAAYFRDEKPDAVIILGDRTEMLGICIAAMNEGVPIIHLHGGELTEGAVDDCVRHAITKISYLHFPATEVYRNRIIQLGESPDRVYNVGALGVENILKVPLMSKEEILKDIGIQCDKYVVMTYQPVTLEHGNEEAQVSEVIQAIDQRKDFFYVITMANADAGGDIVNKMFAEYSKTVDNVKFVSSLGMKRYLSAVKHCEFVLGNSSSGIIEAPALGVPTVNIGDRQKGRLMPESVINCPAEKEAILAAIKIAEHMEHKPILLYGDGNTSEKIVSVIKQKLKNKVNLKKEFYDLNISNMPNI